MFDLTQSNPTHAGIKYPNFYDSLADPRCLEYEPVPFGLRSAREAITGYYTAAGRKTVDPDRMLLTASTSEAYSFLSSCSAIRVMKSSSRVLRILCLTTWPNSNACRCASTPCDMTKVGLSISVLCVINSHQEPAQSSA